MDITDSEADLRDAALLACESRVVGQAVTLARWIGVGRHPVTAGQVLRKADVPAAGRVLGVAVPHRLRTMADLPELNRPWCVAIATGLLRIEDSRVTSGPVLEQWPPGGADLLAGWLTGLLAVCTAQSRPRDEDGVRLLVMAVLKVLSEGAARADRLWKPVRVTVEDLCDRYDKHPWDLLSAVERYFDEESNSPIPWLLDLLDEFGAIAGDVAMPVISPLGRWAAEQLAIGLPGIADASLSAAELVAEVAQFSDDEARGHVASGWLAERLPGQAALEILTAAEQMSPLKRCVAMDLAVGVGEEVLPVLRNLATTRCVGPHARAILADWDKGTEPSDADSRWLDVEFAAAELEGKGPDAALTCVWERMPGTDLESRLAAVRGTGHSDAAVLTSAVAEFATSGAPRAIDQVAELKVSLIEFRPPIWRRVRVPATVTLGDLHVVIQLLFGWDGDHLHVFRAGKKQYSDTFMRLEGTMDEDLVRIQDALALGSGTIRYTYDLGACWEHEITLHSTLADNGGQVYPVCVAYQGDSPVEYWSEDDPIEREPFDQAEVSRRLAALSEAEGVIHGDCSA